MVTISEALHESSLGENEWARHALSTLGDDIDPEMLVIAAVAGWTLRRTAEGDELVDTLFVLTSTHLGFGQTTGGVGDPRWIPLVSVTNADAIDDSPLPLQSIELSIDSTMAMLVGWPPDFTPHVIDALQNTTGLSPHDSMPWELAGNAAMAGDASDLDGMEPSRFTESDVTGDEWPSPFSESSTSSVFGDAPHAEPGTGPPPPGAGFSVSGPPDESAPRPLFSTPNAEPVPQQPEATANFSTAEGDVPGSPSFGGSQLADEDPADAPWMDPGCVWPEQVDGVTYRQGDPAMPRKKKGGVIVFGRRGSRRRGEVDERGVRPSAGRESNRSTSRGPTRSRSARGSRSTLRAARWLSPPSKGTTWCSKWPNAVLRRFGRRSRRRS